MKHEIWLADFTFFYKQTAKEKNEGLPIVEYVIKDVVTPKIPLKFLINNKDIYRRITRADVFDSIAKELENDKSTGLKKFKVTYTKQIQGL